MTGLEAQARTIARFARHLPDRLLHPWRRRNVRQRIARSGSIRRVLFICHGNICRSPYAAAAFRRRLPSGLRSHVVVDSAGFIGPGRPAPQEALIVGRNHGVDLSSHRSQLIAGETFAKYDLVVVMAANQVDSLLSNYPANANVIVLGDLDPHPIKTRTITDPFGQRAEAFEESYSRIDRCIDALVSSMFELGADEPANRRTKQYTDNRGQNSK